MPAKYQAPARSLAAQSGNQVALTLAEMEAIIGAPLPAGARRRQWWRMAQGPVSLRPTVQAAGWRILLGGFWGRTPAVTFVRGAPDDAPAGQG